MAEVKTISEDEWAIRQRKEAKRDKFVRELRAAGWSILPPPEPVDLWLPAINAFYQAMGWRTIKQITSGEMNWLGALQAAVPFAPAQVDRNPKGHDAEERHGRNDESPVANGDAPQVHNQGESA